MLSDVRKPFDLDCRAVFLCYQMETCLFVCLFVYLCSYEQASKAANKQHWLYYFLLLLSRRGT